MAFTIAVLHGPNLHWLGREELDRRLTTRARELGVSLSIVQSNGEAGLLDELQAREAELDAIIVNPGVLAPTAFALAEALELLDLPAVEVLLKPLPAQRGVSALASVVQQQLHGRGVDGYLDALEALANVGAPEGDVVAAPDEARSGKSLGRSKSKSGRVPAKAAPPKSPAKQLGRRAPAATQPAPNAKRAKTLGRRSNDEPSTALQLGLSRSALRAKVNDRLAGRLSAQALAGWARTEWSALQQGGPCEAGQRELLDEVLLTLMAGASDDVLLSQAAKLG